MEVPELSFEDALIDSGSQRRHLLLGNGFSIGLHSGFRYDTLYNVAISDRSIAFLFNELGVTDRNFEEALRRAPDDETRKRIRESLIEAIAKTRPRGIPVSALESCGQFLAHFVGPLRGDQRGSVFTTNYDLLLYRVAIHNRSKLRCYDAFDTDGFWNLARMSTSHIFYLHGGIHIYRREIPPLQSSSRPPWVRFLKLLSEPGDPLMAKIARHLHSGDFPVFVAEGGANEKQAVIGQHDYLRKVRRHFAKVCGLPGSVLFTFGHSLHDVDQHLADQIGRSDLCSVYFGVFGRQDRERAAELAERWNEIREAGGKGPLAVSVFDTRECRVWADAQAGLRAA